jgi:hypothetical protein
MGSAHLPYGDPVTTWEQRMEWPLTVAALLFLGAYAWPILEPGLPAGVHGVGLMIGAIALLGTVTATLASWLVEAVREEADETEDQIDAALAEVRALNDRLDRVLEERR